MLEDTDAGADAGGNGGLDLGLGRGARALVRGRLRSLGLEDVSFDAELVVSELVANAVLHGGGCTDVEVRGVDHGARIEVGDRSAALPVMGWASEEAMTGRGLRLVARLARAWGVEHRQGGKVVWAEVGAAAGSAPELSEAELLALWDPEEPPSEPPRYEVVLGEVPTDLLLGAKAHVDDLIREFALAASGASSGLTAEVPPHLQSLIEVVANRFSDARQSIKRQALAAARAGASHTCLRLELDAGAAEAGEEYLAAVDAVDAYCRAARLLTLETPPQHRVFRHWYVEELIVQLRALAAGAVPRPPQTFEERLLQEVERVATAQRIAEQSARLYTVAGALAGAATPEAVADAVLTEGAAALGASGGGLLLASDADRLIVPGTVGYADDIVARLRAEPIDAGLPAAMALRTGEPVWIESRAERDERFPELVDMEPATVSMCAVPLLVQGKRLGAMRFSFSEPRLFDDDERRFVLTLAGQCAQALERAQLQKSRVEVGRRLQRSLLPPSILAIPGIEAAGVYHPLGDGVDVGGDFYDLWRLDETRYGLAVGDVSGTGPEAAAFTARVRYTLRALTLGGSDQDVLPRLNDVLRQAGPAGNDDEETFCTAIFGVVQPGPDHATVTLVSGGHPFPFLRRARGVVEEVPLGGSLLGVLPSVDVAVAELQLRPEDLLVLFTDGVIEARDGAGRFFGTEGVRRLLEENPVSTAVELLVRLQEAVVAHSEGELADDLAALALRVR